ncbi:MAG: DNA repair protein RadA [Planctomycetes bacterium]|nr:DNA repair protein RadA [Planctomycetota bacterium]
MKKDKFVYVCQQCGYESPKWEGKCPECGEWNTFAQEKSIKPSSVLQDRVLDSERPIPITEVTSHDYPRTMTNITELDKILGGGLVAGSVILVGGDPGIGKSTLLLQMANQIAQQNMKILYVSAEESTHQTKLRAERLNTASSNLFIVSETNLGQIKTYVQQLQPKLVIIDSIQMVYRPDIPSAPGTISQVRESAAELVYMAKRNNIILFLIGHVTKDGSIAGPRTLEHLVDTVLYFEGDRYQTFRLLRAVKNRFGSTNEIGVFEMNQSGLTAVDNPSQYFLSEGTEDKPGSAICPSLLGTRVMLVEIQALTTPGVYGIPTRKVSGLDFNRVALMIAVLQRHCYLKKGKYYLTEMDIFANAVGGVEVDEPAADAAIASAIASNFLDRKFPSRTAVIGEVGLSGEIRGVTQINLRVQEAARLGFSNIIVPADNAKGIVMPPKCVVQKVRTLKELIKMLEAFSAPTDEHGE